ncbi:MAG TPA: ABC transporter permease, partial [Kofleriaceae bacterium]|nr:ABC transporter permease [Kofleriaceae bacterium]
MIGAAIRKDALLLLRDRGALLSLFLLPVVFMGFFGAMFSGQGEGGDRRREIAVAAPAASERARAAVLAIGGSGLFEVREEPTAERVRALVADEEVAAGVIFPEDYDPAGGVPAELSIDLAASPQVRGPIEGALTGILTAALRGEAPPRVLEPRSPPGLHRPLEGADGFQVAVPGNAVLFGFFLALTVGLSFVEERTSGTFRRLLAAPIRRRTALLAKLVPYYLIGLIQMLFLFGLGVVAFGMQVGGSWVGLALLTAAVVFASVSLGLLIASFSGTERQVGGVGSICLLVMALVGGS